MFKCFRIVLLIGMSSVFAQENPVDSLAIQQQKIDSTKIENTAIVQENKIDSVTTIHKDIELTGAELPKIDLANSDSIPKDTLTFYFNELKKLIKSKTDNNYAQQIDSLWLKELYSNDLYDSITQARFECKR